MRSAIIVALGIAILLTSPVLAEEDSKSKSEAAKARLQAATEHMQRMELRLEAGDDLIELIEHPLLTFGDAARANENGTLWAWKKSGRPLALLELYQPSEGESWVHAISLTGMETVLLNSPHSMRWTPQIVQFELHKIPDAERPAEKNAQRLRQMKDLARRFTAHEFWDPKNSRFELRLLVQPVHRYASPSDGLHDGAVFVLAHGTNPEVLLQIEAVGKTLKEAEWQFSLARTGSAEMHVELDGKEVWTVERVRNVVGQPTDPYWLFVCPVLKQEP